MRTAIVYYSKHHGNTKKLLDAIAAAGDVTLIDAATAQNADLSAYDTIGFASGIYFSKFHKSVLSFAASNCPNGKKVFFVYTYGAAKDTYTKAIREALGDKSAEFVGEYGCRGFDSYGPFKLIGGIAKGHPNNDEIKGAVEFFKGLK